MAPAHASLVHAANVVLRPNTDLGHHQKRVTVPLTASPLPCRGVLRLCIVMLRLCRAMLRLCIVMLRLCIVMLRLCRADGGCTRCTFASTSGGVCGLLVRSFG